MYGYIDWGAPGYLVGPAVGHGVPYQCDGPFTDRLSTLSKGGGVGTSRWMKRENMIVMRMTTMMMWMKRENMRRVMKTMMILWEVCR